LASLGDARRPLGILRRPASFARLARDGGRSPNRSALATKPSDENYDVRDEQLQVQSLFVLNMQRAEKSPCHIEGAKSFLDIQSFLLFHENLMEDVAALHATDRQIHSATNY
jgi:hypothetical protein